MKNNNKLQCDISGKQLPAKNTNQIIYAEKSLDINNHNEVIIDLLTTIDNTKCKERDHNVMTTIAAPVVVVINNNKKSVQKNWIKCLPENIPAFGIILMALSATSYSLGSLIIKLLPELHSLEVLFFRCTVQFLVNLVYALVKGQPLAGESGSRVQLFMRGLYGTVSSMGSFMAFGLIPLSDATTIQFSSPVFVTLFAYFILKEPLTILQVLTGTITLSGVVVIARPKLLFSPNYVIPYGHIEGLLSAIMGAFGNAMAIITLRRLKSAPVAVVVVWYSVAIMIATLATLLMWDQFRWPVGWRVWTLLLAIGITGIGDQLFMTVALRYESAGPASIARTLTIVLSFVWDVLVLNGAFNGTAAIGAALVSTGVVILGAYKWSEEKPEQYKRLKEWCLSCGRHR
ncbi:solute carrier family 35 member G1-like [Oppia nitens]|uniref:solute carrier family 35 member G1-like n=1 Tax=Oppia nitens TaxID=1686743 RepID=UPI0023DA2104|nr:solute carrier family 35 member G1-like [Oppia nitens]